VSNEQKRFDTSTLTPRREIPVLGPYVPPRTPTERQLAVMWQDALGIDEIGIRDSYDDLGRDSLLAAGIFVEIEEVFGVVIPMAALVDAPTIEQLARKIDEVLSKPRK
jgi:acyl carrier protein